MKIIQQSALLLTALCAPVLAGTTSLVSAPPEVVLPEAKPFFTGSFTTAWQSNYTGRGYVVSRQGLQGEGCVYNILRLNHDIGDSKWSYNGIMTYNIAYSGHSLFGTPAINPSLLPAGAPAMRLPEANLENEFIFLTELKYTANEKFNIGFGHNFVHGGILGVMAKHFADKDHSYVNEFFINPEYNPYQWASLSCRVRYSTSGVKGWWFEPTVAFKAPVIGTPEDVTLAAILSFHVALTADYFQEYHGACSNGSQAFWIKLATPWFVTDDKRLIITPSLSANWLGKGALKANKKSGYKAATLDNNAVPFQTFAVVANVAVTYTF